MIRDTSATDRVMTAPPRSRAKLAMLAAGAVVVLLITGFAVPSVSRWLSASRSVSSAQIRTAEVVRGTLVRDISVQGRVVAAVSPTLYAPVAGTVTLVAKAGDIVEKDDVLAELASPELKSRLDQESATLQSLESEVARARIQNQQAKLTARRTADQAEVDLAAAQREWERAELSWTKGVISKVDHLTAKDNLRKAELTNGHAQEDARLQTESLALELRTRELALQRQEVNVVELTRQVDALKIRAPVGGQVGTIAVMDKASVAANAPLVTVVDLSVLEVEVEIPEIYADDLGLGMGAEIRLGAQTHAGKLSSISPEVVEGQVRGRVRFEGEQPPGLRQSQRLSARIVIEEKPGVLMIARGPFFDSDGGRYAYVVDDGIAVRRPIRTGSTSMIAVEVLEGLSVGDTVIVSATDDFEGAERISVR
ncbi:MAG TPA: HlyD family efflux transporter periplasmic adaptor subunit [Candidatus Saccharimonadia bacterium]|nr:HlyD family efflux transporter periplasmic adaptor subunit [Candidatus Saccharimonadia bacterium]